MPIVYSSVIGYILGCINPSFLISKLKGIDIREKGSGNAGASNALIVIGKSAGIISALFDIMKAYFAYKISEKLFPECQVAGVVAGILCIFGHIFPIFMGFRGGKGLATLGGTILAYDLRVFAVLLLCEAIIVLVSGYLCFVPITASAIFTVYYGIVDRNVWVTVLFAAVTVIIFLKHLTNLKRIKNGTEMHISYLWNKEAEESRIRENMNK